MSKKCTLHDLIHNVTIHKKCILRVFRDAKSLVIHYSNVICLYLNYKTHSYKEG